VEGYAVIAKQLSDMLRKEVMFEFQDQQFAAFKKLKEALISRPVLTQKFIPMHPSSDLEPFCFNEIPVITCGIQFST